MGYTTEFEGSIAIEPPLELEQAREVNDFCAERHGGDMQVHPGFPSFWCDFETDSKSLYWNGSEKSYSMERWLPLLIERFFKPWGRVLNGHLDAQGEAPGDVWRLEVRDNVVVQKRGRLVFEED